MKKLIMILLSLTLLAGCSREISEPVEKWNDFPAAAASFPLQSLLEDLQSEVSEPELEGRVELCGSTQAAWRTLIRIVNPEPRMILAYAPSVEMIRELKSFDTRWKSEGIGYDALVMVTGKNNPVDSLSISQIRDIYSGKITNWKEVGGRDEEIRIFIQDQDSGLQTAFEHQVMQTVPVVKPQTEWIYERKGVAVERLASFDAGSDALGFTSRSLLQQIEATDKVKTIRADNVAATMKTIEDHSYPLILEVYLATNEEHNELIQKILQWFETERGRQFLREHEFVPER